MTKGHGQGVLKRKNYWPQVSVIFACALRQYFSQKDFSHNVFYKSTQKSAWTADAFIICACVWSFDGLEVLLIIQKIWYKQKNMHITIPLCESTAFNASFE